MTFVRDTTSPFHQNIGVRNASTAIPGSRPRLFWLLKMGFRNATASVLGTLRQVRIIDVVRHGSTEEKPGKHQVQLLFAETWVPCARDRVEHEWVGLLQEMQARGAEVDVHYSFMHFNGNAGNDSRLG
eukprot:CCRYP_008675-RA/>CCRYP_008675-RA protein AED:0.00 eAED:0.00 QI:371/1/1/1/0/0/2/83/127